MLEHRLLYKLSDEEDADLTIISTSRMILEAKRAPDHLTEICVSVEIINLHSIFHPDKKMILKSVEKTRKMFITDTSWVAYRVVAEMNRIVNEYNPSILKAPTHSMGMINTPCPSAKVLESMYYPYVHDIVDVCAGMVIGKNHAMALPKKESMTDFYKYFKGAS